MQVLWAESGWKPVPLVDIVEGNAVKRAYQRALLCLHPDKLQQKGAASHQKYIAEKVFDILQVKFFLSSQPFSILKFIFLWILIKLFIFIFSSICIYTGFMELFQLTWFTVSVQFSKAWCCFVRRNIDQIKQEFNKFEVDVPKSTLVMYMSIYIYRFSFWLWIGYIQLVLWNTRDLCVCIP